MKTQDKKEDSTKQPIEAITAYCATNPVFDESNQFAAKAISSMEGLPVPEVLQKLIQK